MAIQNFELLIIFVVSKALTGYVSDSATVDYLKSDDSKDHEEIENDVVVINANARITCAGKKSNKVKQVSMNNFIKTIK